MQNAKCVFASLLCVCCELGRVDFGVEVFHMLSSPLKVEHFGEVFTSAVTDSRHLT